MTGCEDDFVEFADVFVVVSNDDWVDFVVFSGCVLVGSRSSFICECDVGQCSRWRHSARHWSSVFLAVGWCVISWWDVFEHFEDLFPFLLCLWCESSVRMKLVVRAHHGDCQGSASSEVYGVFLRFFDAR